MSAATEDRREVGSAEMRRTDQDGFTVIEQRWSPDHGWVEIWSGDTSQAGAVWATLTNEEA